MIIKNPYNIIAKHFRIINAFVLLPMVYLLYKFKDISGFFRDYVRSGYKTIETNFADTYVTTLMFVALVFMVAFYGILYGIFLAKKKKGTIFGIGAIIYMVMIALALLFHGTMSGITNIEATFANFVRDMANLSVFPQIFMILVALTNASGFNIKTLRFEKKSALAINEDDEEIEIKIGSEGNSAKKTIVHLIRELKYYILENKFVFSVLGGIVLIAIVITLYINIRVNNRVYTFNQEVSADTFNIALKDSFISDVDYKGNVIAKDVYFLVVKIGLVNKSYDTTIDKSVFRITFGDTTLFPTYDRSSRFIDIGKPYEGQIVKYNEENDYVFVYELKKNQIKSSYKMKILNTLKQQDGNLKATYKIINIRPRNITKTVDLGKSKLGKEIKLKDTTLGDTRLTIKNYQVTDIYTYETEKCDEYDCKKYKQSISATPGKSLMIIEDDIKYDEKSSYYRNSYKDFYGDFVNLIVKPPKSAGGEDRQAYKTTMKNVTPKDLTDKKIYEVTFEAINAEKLSMQIQIRNSFITVELKG